MYAPAPAPSALVGRDRELATLHERLASALAGNGGLVLIGGEAGIGKTALAEVVCREAGERGALVLVGRCYDLSETPPYGPWVEALADAPGDRMPPLPTALLPPERDGERLVGRDTVVRRTLAYLAAFAATRPLALLLDDLHWADPASLDLLRVVGRGLADLPLLLLATYRVEEVGRAHPLAPLLPLLVREARAARLDLRPLDAAAIGALVAARYALDKTDHDRLVRYLTGRSEGNALFLGELLRTLEGEGVLHPAGDRWALGDLARIPVPPLLRQVIEGRLHRLGPEAERLLAVAAVIGQEVPLTVWAAVGGVAEGDLLDHIDRARAAHLLVETPGGEGVRFAHALIREALYEGSPSARRRDWHRRVGEALLAMPPPDPGAVAHHFGRAGDPRAFVWLVRAGLRAQRAAAWLTAAERFAAAAALPDGDGTHDRARGWLLFCRGQLLLFSDNAQSLDALDAAESLAVAAGDTALAAHVRINRGEIRCLGGEIRLGMAEIERGVAELDALPTEYRLRPGLAVGLATLAALSPEGERAALEVPPESIAPPVTLSRPILIGWLAHTGRYREALAMGEAFIAALGTAPDFVAQHALGHANAALGHPEESRRAYALSRAGHDANNNAHMVGFTIWSELLLAVLPYQADDVAERTRLAAEAARAWERARGTITETPHGDPTGLFPALVEGRWADAERLARGTLAAATAGHVQGAIVALGVLARHRGEPERAWERVRALHPAGAETEPGDCYFAHGIALQALAAELALDAGDLGTAADWIAAHGRWLDWSGAVLWRADHLLLRARHARASGEAGRAREHAEAALRQASEPRQPLRLLAAHRLLGELATSGGDHRAAAAHLDAALALADACHAPYERALTLLVLAALRAASHDTGEPRHLLDEVRAICAPLGAAPALARADALAGQLADAVPSPADFPSGLSAREVDVLRLIARGLSNREIAATLFISSRTVNRHIENLYRKIDARSKADATAYALRHDLA